MKRPECRGHVWLLTSEHLEGPEPTIRVKCWLCWKRHRWPAARQHLVRGSWREWLRIAERTR